ncbi:MAG TPA: hydroxyacylglutathione hydrolase, partial [Pseudobdellovibrionaceae bacterium]|nr:hydroxyacylglutathione hydrolase [Pseudobdellovibrionaceae bacterium]
MKRVHLIPALQDNYIFCLRNGAEALIVDPGEAGPVRRFLRDNSLSLTGILITHHHHDHVGGVSDLLAEFSVPVWIPEADQGRFEFGGIPLKEGDSLSHAGFQFRVWELPGHTLDHIAYVEETEKWIFSGDVLFGFGCGRLFEGSYEQAFASLQRFRDLSSETLVYCAHEYTVANLKFLETLPVASQKRNEFQALLSEQKKRLEKTGAT